MIYSGNYTTSAALIDLNTTSASSISVVSTASSTVTTTFSHLLYTPHSAVDIILNDSVVGGGGGGVGGVGGDSGAVSGGGGGGGNFTYTTSGGDSFNAYPAYMRTTSMVFCIIIMCLGVIGNVMVPIVIFKTKDMRNSTNIFLVNLSVADLMVLLVCTPTVLVEVNAKPEVWVLGEEMCKAVPFVELTVAHASVLTILAISFERYYAICKPLKAGYICTKARASLICLLAWFIAAIFTSPMLAITKYTIERYYDNSLVPVCFSQVDTLLPSLFIIVSITVFFFVPLAILIILYALIAKTLMEHPNMMTAPYKNSTTMPTQSVIKYRKQVVLMLGTVVLAFFICLLPFRALVLWIILVPADSILKYGLEGYWNVLYFCRIMFHINSAINPILYNIMSSKFREGFFRLCGLRRLRAGYYCKTGTGGGISINRKNTFNTTSSSNAQNNSSSQQQQSSSSNESFWHRYSSGHRHFRRADSSGSGKDSRRDTFSTPVKDVEKIDKTANNNKERHLRDCYVRVPLHPVESLKSAKILLNGESYV